MEKKSGKEGTLAENQLLPARWGQERRLEFIEFRLQWEGKVNRTDLVNFFSISTPQASLDFARYRELAPTNAVYDVLQKTYVASESFKPVLVRDTAEDYLTRLWSVSTGALSTNSSFLGWTPNTGIVRDPARSIDSVILRVVLMASRERRTARIKYQSMSSPSPSSRLVSPHALGFDGRRWHMRAYCHTRNEFRDFVLGRIRAIHLEGTSEIDAKNDADWNNYIEAIIVPHPSLSTDQRDIVEADYCMQNGRLVLRVQEALLLYYLDHLGLLEQPENPRRHLALGNRQELRPFFRKHGIDQK